MGLGEQLCGGGPRADGPDRLPAAVGPPECLEVTEAVFFRKVRRDIRSPEHF